MKTLNRLRLKALSMLLLFLAAAFSASAQYSIYSFAGDVQVKRAGKMMSAANEMKITSADRLILGPNSSLQILNARDSRLYKCDRQGEHTLSGIMLDADNESNSSTLHRRMRMGKGDVQEGTMYVEKGKVTRALDTFDPAAVNVHVDPVSLANYIAAALGNPAAGNPFPAVIETENNGSGLSFEITNTMSDPLYINVITIGSLANGEFDISRLGQPVGAYVLLPNQSIRRAQLSPAYPGEQHLIVATDYYFSIDELIDNLSRIFKENTVPAIVPASMPVYLNFITESNSKN